MDLLDKQAAALFTFAKRPVFLRVNLDTILNNLMILKGLVSKHTECIAVVKANAYGHGSVQVSRYLQKHGISTFAVATALEGQELRSAGIHGNIQVFGNACEEEIPTLVKSCLIPTVAGISFLSSWLQFNYAQKEPAFSAKGKGFTVGPVIIMVDTGMSSNGCQLFELPTIVEFCEENGIPIHSIMTHLADPWNDARFTQEQLDTFIHAVEPYRSAGIKVHIANSVAVINGVGTDLDFVRLGTSMYGQPLSTADSHSVKRMVQLGLRPAISWFGKATKVTILERGRYVGYGRTYTCSDRETIATIPVGYADGYRRNLSCAEVTTLDGAKCPVVGRVSMDAITVRLPERAKDSRHFCLMADDFNDVNSCLAIARKMNTITNEICSSLCKRVPRIYEISGRFFTDV